MKISIYSVLFRIITAVAIGGLIGMEREAKGRPAGFRTYMFTALGATAAMILNQYMYYMQNIYWAGAALPSGTDTARLGAQVINGVGFLGAGTILMTQRQEIKGLTTAAGLWTSACLGIAIGAGFYECALCGALSILLCMSVFSKMESRIMSKVKNMNIYIEMEKYEDLGPVLGDIRGRGMKVFSVDIDRRAAERGRVAAVISIFLARKSPHTAVLTELSAIDRVMLVSEV